MGHRRRALAVFGAWRQFARRQHNLAAKLASIAQAANFRCKRTVLSYWCAFARRRAETQIAIQTVTSLCRRSALLNALQRWLFTLEEKRAIDSKERTIVKRQAKSRIAAAW